MKLQLQSIFTCIIITRKPKLYVAMFHASQHLLLEVNETTRFRRKKLNMRNKLARNKLEAFADQVAL